MYGLKCIYSVKVISHQEVMQKNLIVHAPHHLSGLTTFCSEVEI